MKDKKIHILIADSDVSLSTVLGDYLRSKDFEVECVGDGASVIERLHDKYFDLCLLELSLSEKSGFEVLKYLSVQDNSLPVIVLTTHSSRDDMLRAFDLGADDYVTKPFSMDVLICRIHAVIRRYRAGQREENTEFDLGGVKFDSVRQLLGDKHLSARENDLLLILCQSMGMVVDRHLILSKIWGVDNTFSSRSLSVYANHLRGLLKGTGMEVIGVHGKGYKLIQNN